MPGGDLFFRFFDVHFTPPALTKLVIPEFPAWGSSSSALLVVLAPTALFYFLGWKKKHPINWVCLINVLNGWLRAFRAWKSQLCPPDPSIPPVSRLEKSAENSTIFPSKSPVRISRQDSRRATEFPMTDPFTVLLSMVLHGSIWIPSIYPLYVSINIPAPWTPHGVLPAGSFSLQKVDKKQRSHGWDGTGWYPLE